ncbi:MAG: TetR family transcriptional regulator [Alphaproteobacteria bacterium]|jgi:TetR/AcrR family transcriptional repressor of mexJK operon|nr:TetR family transcriptional regulator [Alphaproteobacteria bacterium]
MIGTSQLTHSTGTRRQRNAADKRRVILRGAREVFMAHGFGGASMDAIADAASVSKMTLYRYFDSKEALFAGLIEEQCERILEQDPAAPLAGLQVREALTRFGERLLEIVYAPETLALHRIVLAEAHRFPELGILFYRSGPERNISALAEYLANLAAEGRLAVDEPRKSAEEFFELVRGYTHLRLLLGVDAPPHPAAIKKQVARAVETVLKTL